MDPLFTKVPRAAAEPALDTRSELLSAEMLGPPAFCSLGRYEPRSGTMQAEHQASGLFGGMP